MTPNAQEFFDFGRSLAADAGEKSGGGSVLSDDAVHGPAAARSPISTRRGSQSITNDAGVKAGGGGNCCAFSKPRRVFQFSRAAGAPFGGGVSHHTHCCPTESANPSPSPAARVVGLGPEPNYRADRAAHHRFAVQVLAAVGVALRDQEGAQ